jgi:hypothetical protein
LDEFLFPLWSFVTLCFESVRFETQRYGEGRKN